MDRDAKAISECMGSGNYYSQVVRVGVKRVRVEDQRDDGDCASDNRSAEGLGLGRGLASLARVGPWGFRGERRG